MTRSLNLTEKTPWSRISKEDFVKKGKIIKKCIFIGIIIQKVFIGRSKHIGIIISTLLIHQLYLF